LIGPGRSLQGREPETSPGHDIAVYVAVRLDNKDSPPRQPHPYGDTRSTAWGHAWEEKGRTSGQVRHQSRQGRM